MYQDPWQPNFQLAYPPEKRQHCDSCKVLLADGYYYMNIGDGKMEKKPINICQPCLSKKKVAP